MTFKTN